jgi:AraC-like DNA-binding protein
MRVRRIIYELLMAGKVTSPLICAQLNIHERVLRRSLHNEGTSIKDLISTARHELARQLLGNTQLSVAEIAKTLGYSDVTAFSRAFRGWEGIPPDRWRRQDAHWLKLSRH